MKNFEDIEITDEQAEVIRESLTAWKEEMFLQLSEDVESEKATIRDQLEKEADEYKASLKEEFTEKFITALEEMRKHVKAEVLAETIQTNPALQILEEIKEKVAPLLNEDYVANSYSSELIALKEENELLKREIELEEGAKQLAMLISPYSDKVQDFILSMIEEGSAEEITEQFYNIVEQLENLSEVDKDEDDEDDEDEDDEDEDEDEDDDEDEKDEKDDKKKNESKDYTDEEVIGESVEEGKNVAKKGSKALRGIKDLI